LYLDLGEPAKLTEQQIKNKMKNVTDHMSFGPFSSRAFLASSRVDLELIFAIVGSDPGKCKVSSHGSNPRGVVVALVALLPST
jgi:hypothetical protein